MFAPVDIGPSLDRALVALSSPGLVATLESRSKKGKTMEVSAAAVRRGSDGTWAIRMQSPPTSGSDRADLLYLVRT
ncbi:hypothetical protein EON79_10535, partial [bacterium]